MIVTTLANHFPVLIDIVVVVGIIALFRTAFPSRPKRQKRINWNKAFPPSKPAQSESLVSFLLSE